MRSADHKAEAERLIDVAKSDEGFRADDPRDPFVLLQLALLHAQLACVPDLALGEYVGEDASDEALAAVLANRTSWEPQHWSVVITIARTSPDVLVVPKSAIEALRGKLAAADAGANEQEINSAASDAIGTLDEWIGGFPS